MLVEIKVMVIPWGLLGRARAMPRNDTCRILVGIPPFIVNPLMTTAAGNAWPNGMLLIA